MSYCSVSMIAHAGFMQADLVERRVSSSNQTHVISCERRSLYVCHYLMSWSAGTSIGLFCEDHSSLGRITLVL